MSWKSDLSEQQRREIHTLLRIKPMWNLVILFFVTTWVGAGWALLNTDMLIVRILCYVVIGISLHAMANLMHEGSHGNLFRNNRWDRIVSFLLVVPAFLSASAYTANHYWHHRYTKTENDPDEFKNISSNRIIQSIAFYIWILIGTIAYLFHVPISAITRGRKYELGYMATEYSLLLLIYVSVCYAAFAYNFIEELIELWIIPLFVANVLANIRGWA